MKKFLLIIGVLVMFSFTPNVNSTSIQTSPNLEVVNTDCDALAQGYYEFLRDEGVGAREAGSRARQLRDYCEEAQQ